MITDDPEFNKWYDENFKNMIADFLDIPEIDSKWNDYITKQYQNSNIPQTWDNTQKYFCVIIPIQKA